MNARMTDSERSHLAVLLPELGCRMLSFLSSPDAVRFSENFPQNGYALSCAARERCLFQFERWHGDFDDQPLRSIYRIPVLTGISHSVAVKFSWKDQGWGHRKGQVYIVGTLKKPAAATSTESTGGQQVSPSVDPDTDPARFQGGRVVCMTEECAPQQWAERELSFLPRDNEVYYLWHKAGGGGGHQLMLQNFFDDAECHRARMYERLLGLGIVGSTRTKQETTHSNAPLVQSFVVVNGRELTTPLRVPDSSSTPNKFYPKMLLRVCTSLLRQLQTIEEGQIRPFATGALTGSNATRFDPDLVEFMRDYEIPVTRPSLLALHDVVSADMEDCDFEAPGEEQDDATRNNEDGNERRHIHVQLRLGAPRHNIVNMDGDDEDDDNDVVEQLLDEMFDD